MTIETLLIILIIMIAPISLAALTWLAELWIRIREHQKGIGTD